jgi:hypothetical protein
MNPEQKAREQIDKLLRACGGDVQNYRAFNPAVGRGIALREVPVTGRRRDYLLLADRKPLGVIAAKKRATMLSSIADRLNLSEIKSIVLPVPPQAEQKRIVAEVERRLSVVEDLEAVVGANLQRAARLRQGILQKVFTKI